MSKKLPSTPIKVFISYAHQDAKLKDRLIKHLASLKHQGVIEFWHDQEITSGEEWRGEIEKHLNTAQVILLLVSADFLASNFAYDIEFKLAMERHKRGDALLIPVILRPCHWQNTPIASFQVLPPNAEPVVNWSSIDAAMLSVVKGIETALVGRSETLRYIKATKAKTRIILTFKGSPDNFKLENLSKTLRDSLGVDLERITISVQSGSIKVIIEGDPEELARIINALRDPGFQQELAEHAPLTSISYFERQQEQTIAVEAPSTPENDAPAPYPTPIEVLRQAIRAVPAVKFALGVAGIAAAVAIVAGFSIDYKVAVLGTVIMFGLMFGLVAFSWFTTNAAASIRPLSLTLAWTFVILISSTSFCIFTGFFFQWPRPLGSYVDWPSPSPTPPPSPTPLEVKIVITDIPPRDPVGGPNVTAYIAGKVSGINPDHYRVVVYSLTTTWYVQPIANDPMTAIRSDGTWSAQIRLGRRYVALLVPKNYDPPAVTNIAPARLAGIVAATEVEGTNDLRRDQ